MKKLYAFISLLLLLGIGSIYAEVTGKKLPDGTVEVTFFYGNPRANEVVVAGDFTNWQDGAIPMEKGEKGFTLVKIFKMSDVGNYKFISDGNWTTDLRAPEFIDDGFGGKNSHFEVSSLVGGGDDAGGVKKAKINFKTWTMVGFQSNFTTQGYNDPTEKGIDLDSITVGAKSYNKFIGTFLPDCPLYIEIALAEMDMEDYEMDGPASWRDNKVNYLYRKNSFDDETIEFQDGFRDLVAGIFGNPVSYFAQAGDNGLSSEDGPGLRPILGHLKFGWNTPVINILNGFNYGKPDVRNAITWTTISGDWDAGYKHIGGFTQFSLGQWLTDLAYKNTGITFDIGFAPNRSADRKGYNYGYWGWFGLKKDDLVFDLQSNGMYGRDYMFSYPVEHDFIVGIKDGFAVGPGTLSFAVDLLLATHQASSEGLIKHFAGDSSNSNNNITDIFGYSTDVFYRDTDFGVQNLAANVKLGYKAEIFEVGAEYRLRGMQASMLYVRENHDDNAFTISDQLGVLNSQAVTVNALVRPVEGLSLGIGIRIEMPLEQLERTDKEVAGWWANLESWYYNRCWDSIEPLFDRDGGCEVKFTPAVSYKFADAGVTIGAYLDAYVRAFTYSDHAKEFNFDTPDDSVRDKKVDDDDINKYRAFDAVSRIKMGGLNLNWTIDNPAVKGFDFYYGFDLQNKARHFNTLTFQLRFLDDLNVTLGIGIKSKNIFSSDKALASGGWLDNDHNNPFAIAIGIAKKFKGGQKPTLYGQFVYNMDPYKHFGDGQDQLNLDRSNVNGSWAKEGSGSADPVDWYDGRAALRVGVRWDI